MFKINKHFKLLLIAIAVAVVGVILMVLLSQYGGVWFPEIAGSMAIIVIVLYFVIFAVCMALLAVMVYGMVAERAVARAKTQQEVEQQSNSAVQDTTTGEE